MRKAMLICLVLCLAGCVSTRVKRVNPDYPNWNNGFRYYLPAPYLLVREEPVIREVKTPLILDGKVVKGAYEEALISQGRMEILYLPDPQREMAANSSSFLSSQKLNLQIEEGWKLTEVSGESDSSVAAQSLAGVLEQMTQGASDIASAVLPVVASRETPVVPLSLEPGLYRILIKEDGSVILRKAEVRWDKPDPAQ